MNPRLPEWDPITKQQKLTSLRFGHGGRWLSEFKASLVLAGLCTEALEHWHLLIIPPGNWCQPGLRKKHHRGQGYLWLDCDWKQDKENFSWHPNSSVPPLLQAFMRMSLLQEDLPQTLKTSERTWPTSLLACYFSFSAFAGRVLAFHIFYSVLIFFFFWDSISYTLGCPQTGYVASSILELLVLFFYLLVVGWQAQCHTYFQLRSTHPSYLASWYQTQWG